jgi:uncharacterized membrane protein
MIINNPFQMNDWKFGQFIKTVIILQILMLFITLLSVNGTVIPFISSLVGFIYLTFIPGYLILRVLKIHNLGSVKSLLYAVGLSISSVMFLGYMVNTVLPWFGLIKPIALIPLSLVFLFFVVFLSLLSYVRDKDFSNPSFIDSNELFTPVFLFLCLIPFIAIFGSYSMNQYGNNLISMILIIVVGLILFLVVFDKINKKWYLFTVWIISISLLYFSSLISPYVWGWDIQNEYYLANLILNYSSWNYNLPDTYNAMLSIVMVGPIYSIFTSINLDYIFKIIFPFFFSLVPLGLYKIFKTQIDNSKLAFLAVFLFMSFNTFYIELLTLSREMTAELFMVVLLLLIFERKFKPYMLVLITIFSVSLVVSHYSLTYFLIATLVGVIVLLTLYNLFKFGLSTKILDLDGKYRYLLVLIFITALLSVTAYIWYGFYAQGLAIKSINDVSGVMVLNISQILNSFILNASLTPSLMIYSIIIVLLIIVFSLAFYIFSKIEKRIESIGYTWIDKIIHIIPFKIDYRILALLSIVILIGLTYYTGPLKTWIVTVLRYLNFTVTFFTVTGLLMVFLHFYKNKFQIKYLGFSILGVIMLLSGFVLPSFESAFNITRIYEIAFMILSPFCVIGGMKILGSIYQFVRGTNMDTETPLKIFSIFLLIFMLFNTGFVSVLSNQSIPMQLSNGSTSSDYYPLFNIPESNSAQWLSNNKVTSSIYADVYGRFIFNRYLFSMNETSINNGVSDFTNYNSTNSYIYLRKLDINNMLLTGFTGRNDRNRIYLNMSVIINPKNKIFDDGDSKIFYS